MGVSSREALGSADEVLREVDIEAAGALLVREAGG